MHDTLAIDPALLGRYDRPGPRYTSYPTALEFQAGFGPSDFASAAMASRSSAQTTPLSIYVHVPYCFSPCFYCGCTRAISRDPQRGHDYLALLERELVLTAPLFAAGRRVTQVHFGGGTPNFLAPAQLRAMLNIIAAEFGLAETNDREVSIELDPRTLSAHDAAALVEGGFNRASIGVQDFDPLVQETINRLQSVEQTAIIIDALRNAGIRSVNVDLVYGLPHQTPASFERTLDAVLTLRPDRIALYGYAHLPQRFKAQRRIPDSALPGASERLCLFTQGLQGIGAAGYEYIGMDHFALPDDDLVHARSNGSLKRNFMGYTTQAGSDLIGLGASAISHVGRSYSQNAREVADYAAHIQRDELAVERGCLLDDDDDIRAALIQDLMCYGEVDWTRYSARFGIATDDYFAEDFIRLDTLIQDGLVSNDPERLRVLPRGRLLLRNIAMCFDRYLHHAQTSRETHYSRTV